MPTNNTGPLADLSDTEVKKLTLIAQHGNRKFVMWELASDGRDFCGVAFTATESGMEHQPMEAKVKRFVEDMEAHESTYFSGVNWDRMEELYGDIADAIMEQTDE